MLDRPVQEASLQAAKAVVQAYYTTLDTTGPEAAVDVMDRYHTPDLLWRGFHPFHEITGPHAVGTQFWRPLKTALSHMRRRLDLFMAGVNALDGESVWVGSMGHLQGLFDRPWQGIRPTGKLAMLRYAAFHRVNDGKIAETAMFFDIPHLMMQAGYRPFPPQTAAELVQPGPMTHHGVMNHPQDPAEGEATLRAINAMIADISLWSGGKTEPLVEELRRTWHEDMTWWGPTGIGAAYTIPRYAEQHAGPFRAAFGERTFNGHIAKIAEGEFGGFFGWPNLTLEHKGGFMGMPGTGQKGDMRVIDMYRRQGDKLAENWIFIDLLHFWSMQGVDILTRATGIEAPTTHDV